MLLPRTLRTVPAATGLGQPALRAVTEVSLSIIQCPHDHYVPEFLARVIRDAGLWSRCAWARVPERQPIEMADTIVDACLRRWEPVDHSAHPFGLDPTPRPALSDLYDHAPPGTITVVEVEGAAGYRGGRFLGGMGRIAKERGHAMVIATPARLHRSVRHEADLRLTATSLGYEPAGYGEGSEWFLRLMDLVGTRASLAYSVCAAARVWPDDLVAEVTLAAHGRDDLVLRLTEVLLDRCPPYVRRALGIALETGYWQSDLGDVELSPGQVRPWLIPLEQGWGVLDPSWEPALRTRLTRSGSLRRMVWHADDGRMAAGADQPEVSPAPTGPLIDVHLLGGFDVVIDGQPVSGWHGRLGQSIFRYLLMRRAHSCSRDELLNAFWPEAPPDAARNRLQVAVSGLRRAFREITDEPIIEFGDDAYSLAPGSQLVVDTERFETAIRHAQAAHRREDHAQALSLYRDAIRLYRGDFAPDVPYEEWTLLPRERLRILYLDALDRAGHLELAFGLLDACIDTAQLMLDQDPCREDAHRLLMYCFAEQHRPHLVDQQYQFCTRVLQG